MGLAGRKEKQRIGPDPRNLTWAQDDSRFGQQYLAKFGWTPDSGSGLGANLDGRLAHISVAQKLNLLGIGNGPSGGANTPDAIAWKQSKDFESVLKRLNGGEVEEVKLEQALLHGFVRGEITESTIGNPPTPEGVLDEKTEKQRRKEEKKRRKQEQVEGKTEDDLQASTSEQPIPEVLSSNATPTSQPRSSGMGPRMAHRAKFRASKQLASLSSAALSEILGVSPSGSATPVSTTQSNTVPVAEQSVTNNNAAPTAREDQLTTSPTSVADYFAAKMAARRLGTQVVSESQSPLESDSPAGQDQEEDKFRERKRKDKKRKREVERIGGGQDAMDIDEAPAATAESEKPHKSQKEETRKEKKEKRRKEVEDA